MVLFVNSRVNCPFRVVHSTEQQLHICFLYNNSSPLSPELLCEVPDGDHPFPAACPLCEKIVIPVVLDH